MRVCSRTAKLCVGLFGLAIVVAIAITSWPKRETPGIPVQLPGPHLQNPGNLAGLTAYNSARGYYLSGDARLALSQISKAVRSKHLSGRNKGFGFANLCVLYWQRAEWKQAFAACVKAKALLPGNITVLENTERIKARERID